MCGNEYRRVRLGVGHPGDRDLVYPYLLSDFAKSDRDWVEAVCEAVADAAELLAAGRPEEFQNRVHLALADKGFPPARRDEPDKPAA
jgi:PTH1 family peptidyl-tRNA hydrolase